MSESGFLKAMIELMGTDDPIPLPNVSSSQLSMILSFCETRFRIAIRSFLVGDPYLVLSDVQTYLGLPQYAEQSKQESTWGVENNDAKLMKEVCTANVETIKGLHEAAKYLDMPNLMYLTEAFLKEGFRPFMDVLLPWENFSNVGAHRKPAVKVL